MIVSSPGSPQESETSSWVAVPVRPVGLAGTSAVCAKAGQAIFCVASATAITAVAMRSRRLNRHVSIARLNIPLFITVPPPGKLANASSSL